jgi:hypothetical protein
LDLPAVKTAASTTTGGYHNLWESVRHKRVSSAYCDPRYPHYKPRQIDLTAVINRWKVILCAKIDIYVFYTTASNAKDDDLLIITAGKPL